MSLPTCARAPVLDMDSADGVLSGQWAARLLSHREAMALAEAPMLLLKLSGRLFLRDRAQHRGS